MVTAAKEEATKAMGVNPVKQVSGPNQHYQDEIAKGIEEVWGVRDIPYVTATLNGLASGAAAARTFKSAVDIGTSLVHGLYLLTNDPEKWSKAAAASIQRFADPKYMDNYIMENIDAINEYMRYGWGIPVVGYDEGARLAGRVRRVDCPPDRPGG